jgi:AcrR family transcriptional regulator
VADEPHPGARALHELLGPFQDRFFQERFGPMAQPDEGLRERKKRLMRQLISDTATAMFLERGFDDVRVSEVATACEVSEKTVYNYFPTKESLVLDREDAMADDIRRALGPGAPARVSPIDAAVAVIAEDVRRFYGYWDREPAFDLDAIRRFVDLVESTPSLRAAQRDMVDRLVQVAARAMATRAGMDPADPEPQIAANAILGLWRIQFAAMERHSDPAHTPRSAQEAVIAEVRRAARLIDTGLWSFGLAVQGTNGREQLKAAAESANEARKQVVAAIRQARDAWRQVVAEAQAGDHSHDHAARHRGRGGGRPGPRPPRGHGREGGGTPI